MGGAVLIIVIAVIAGIVGYWLINIFQKADSGFGGKGNGRGYYIRTGIFFAFLIFLYGPIIVIGVLSFQGPAGSLMFPIKDGGLIWFKDVFDPQYAGDFRLPFVRSIVLALIVMVITTLVSFLAGLAFRRGFKGSALVFYVVIISLIAPPFLISFGLGTGFSFLGLQSEWWSGGLGAHLTWTLPFGVLIMFAIFSRLDLSIEEAAKDQGATNWQKLRYVIIPIVAPGMLAVALFGFTLSYDEYSRSYLVTGSGNTLPVTMVAVRGTAARPSLYAVGTMTTIFSLLIITGTFLGLYLMDKRRGLFSGGKKVEEGEIYGAKLHGRGQAAK
jgi:putative spermidine/putrescine transport system permease protein